MIRSTRRFGGVLLALAATIVSTACTRAKATEHEHAAAMPEMAHMSHGNAPAPAGYAPIMLDPAHSGGMAIDTAIVEHRMFEKTVRTVGVVSLDETRTAHVHTKVRGFVESVQADFVGERIRAGAPLCSIYSQPVYAAELEWVALLNQRPAPSSDPLVAATEKRTWDGLVDAGRRRLELWDVPKATIDRIEKTREPSRTFTLSAPRSGVVVAKQAFVGNYVEPDTELYVVSDLAKLWVLVDVYEADLPYVHVGDEARLTIEGLAAPVTAKATFLAPTIDEATRTLKVRFEIENGDRLVRPGAFATAEMKVTIGHGLAVPETAVIHTGPRDLVFVMHGPHVMPREVTLGPLVGGFYRVDKGLEESEAVATTAQFLIDSESQLQATSAGGGNAHAGHGSH